MTDPPTRRVDAASLVILRVIVGLLVFVSAVRFVAKGWVEELLLAPEFHFRYWGFTWVPEPSPALAYALFAIVAASGLALAAGWAVRASAALACLAFTWLELVDLSYYLNHYYFLSCLLLCFALVPPRPEHDGAVPAWKLGLVRAQIGLVYVYAGIAKLDGDWLVHAQPLRIWLARHADLPLVGPWMNEAWLAYAASWSGAAFDLFVVPALLSKRTRIPAYLALIGFHTITGALFPIGMFPWVMIGCATIMFEPDWPRRWLAPGSRLDRPVPVEPRREALAGALAALLLLVQIALPWRHLAYPGSVLWHEQGARFSYRVMVVEKGGAVVFRLHDRSSGRTWQVDPQDTELSMLQAKMMSTQPDMIAAYARHLAREVEREQPGSRVEVRVDAFVAVNGRPSARLIDPTVDLAAVEDRLANKAWVLAGPEGLR
ncbi:Vitamin K-dependent gamma-carboxylase [Enhygromyxa salina]|uniref:Vitamin K-dependent gamma-carboxylase n=1 Tax=Enhygromyxa salina TaxID=215803 RepID=A0A2S9XEA6_9BACT|nr:HTTM domain-containing protein [Enhygromyxa salina]PRP91090.1 Vitamin K-dependent gamma-carboxylase [Enhygromyxa salina]